MRSSSQSIRPLSEATSIGSPTRTGTREAIGETDARGDVAVADLAAGNEPSLSDVGGPVHAVAVRRQGRNHLDPARSAHWRELW